eukprot:gene15829-biopygen7960
MFSGHFLGTSWKFAVRQVGCRLASAPISAELEVRTCLETSRKDAGDLLPSWLADPDSPSRKLPGRPSWKDPVRLETSSWKWHV